MNLNLLQPIHNHIITLLTNNIYKNNKLVNNNLLLTVFILNSDTGIFRINYSKNNKFDNFRYV
jgi:hypothetical protein